MFRSQGAERSVRSEIEKLMRSDNYTITKLSELTGIKGGHISEILRRNRAISIKQLDSFAEAFKYDVGWLYEFYIDECVSEKKVSRADALFNAMCRDWQERLY